MNNNITLKDICGYKEEKDEVVKIITLLKDYKKYEKLGVTLPRGIIFQGPPGTGKTLFAKAIANECGYDFFVAFSNDYDERVLDTLKTSFSKAEKHAKETGKPALIYIDELDKLAYTDYDGDLPDSDARDATRYLLQKLDENSKTNRVLIIASTNNYDRIPYALLRSGRFDKKFLIDLPDADSRKEILRHYINGHKLFKNINIDALALKTSGMSGADLKTLINNTLLYYITIKDTIELDDFIKIINEMNFETIGKKWSSKRVSIETLIHEVGHALVEYKLTNKWPNVSAIKYGDFYGFAETVSDECLEEPESLNAVEEEDDMTADKLVNQILIAFAGKASEEVFLNKISVGVAGDFCNIRDSYDILDRIGYFGVSKCDALSPFRRSDDMSKTKIKKSLRFLTKKYKQTLKIIKHNKELCLFLVAKIHEDYNDTISSGQLTAIYKQFVSNEKELKEKYHNLKITDLWENC